VYISRAKAKAQNDMLKRNGQEQAKHKTKATSSAESYKVELTG
jgi:hypothetical protein